MNNLEIKQCCYVPLYNTNYFSLKLLNTKISLVNFVQIRLKVMPMVTMARNVGSKLSTLVCVFLSGNNHSVKVSSNSEPVPAGALLDYLVVTEN